MMNSLLKWLAGITAVIFGAAADMPNVIRILLIVMALDIGCGIAVSIINKKMSAKIALDGVTHKAVILIVVALSYVVASQIAGVDMSAPIGQAVAGFYIAVETISILEKARALGVPIPDFLQAAIDRLAENEKARRITDKTPPSDSPPVEKV